MSGPRKGQVRQSTTKTRIKDDVRFSLIIRDEAHTERGSTQFIGIVKEKMSYSKLVLITGTPWEKGPGDIAEYVDAMSKNPLWAESPLRDYDGKS